MSDWQYIKRYMLRYIFLIGAILVLTLMASKSKASIPDLHMTVSDGMTISLEDPKACEVCHKVYSRCVASVLLGSLPPDAAALKNIDTCKTIELKCTKDYTCANRE